MKAITSSRLLALAMAGCLGLSACGSSDPPAPPPVKDTVFGDMEATKDRARAVEDVTMQQKKSLDEAIDSQSNGAAAPLP
ncbi:MAG: hypothetical protein ABL964_07365 [Steroidobacteraceae bacterium]